MTAEYRQIPLAALRESKTNPRRHFDAKALDELAASIAAHGVIQPIVVRPLNGGDTFEVVAGARRYRASKLAAVIDIPARVRELTDEQVLEIQVIENLQREDVHPLDEAQGYRTLMDKTQHDVAAIAATVGKSESYVYQRLKLCDLTDKAKKAFFDDKITAGHAVLIARLQAKDQAQMIDTCLRAEVSVRDLARRIEREIHMELTKAPFSTDDDRLLPAAGACTVCPKRSGFTPALFPDIKSKDTCTDRRCYQAKIDAVIAQARSKLMARGEKPINISTDHYSSNNKSVVTANNWTKVTKGNECEHARPGIVVDGYNANLGQVISVCTESKCKKHHGGGQSSMRMSPQAKASQEREALKRKAEAIAREQAIQRVLEFKTNKLDIRGQRLIAQTFAAVIWHDRIKEIVDAKGWAPEKVKGSHSRDYRGELEKRINTMPDADIGVFVLELALRTAGMRGDADDLDEYAKDLGIDVKALEKIALAELTAKAKAKAAKKAAPAKKKAKVKIAGHPDAPRKKKVQTPTKKKAT